MTRRRLINNVLVGLILIFTPSILKAQLFINIELYPNVEVIKGKYYNGTGGRGYWSLDYVDSLGRIYKKESYRKKQLMARNELIYDNHNNKIFDIQTFDINNPERIDTNRYEYKYAGNLISYQYRKLSDVDSTVVELIENRRDSLLKYHEKAFYFRPKTGKTDIYETFYSLSFQNDLLINKEIFNKKENSVENKSYEYFENGRLKRRTIKRIPELKIKGVYTGGPGSDDEFYEYKLDSKGRIKTFYLIVNSKKYKIAVYKYFEK